MANAIELLRHQGQSVWLDYIRRGLITSGELERMVRNGWISGITSNPSIFRKAISGSSDYDEALRKLADRGACSPYDAFLELGAEDVRLAADVLRPVYEETEGRDGYVSFEAQEGETSQIIAEVRRMFSLVGRPNVMIKVPGTPAGIQAVEPLIAQGININITLLFDVDVYEQVALAYIADLERRLAAGQPVNNLASVASFFVSRIDTKVDALLPEDSPLRGRVAVANARVAYRRFQQIFAGERWERLAAAGARLQRPLWASTGTKNPAYSDVLYVEELVARDTVNTMPEATLQAFLDHRRVHPMTDDDPAEAERVIEHAAQVGIDLKTVTTELLDEGLAAFAKDFEKLLEEIGKALAATPTGRLRHRASLHGLTNRVDALLEALREQDIVRRIWQRDQTVWKPQAAEITDRLGWLTVVDTMLGCVDDLRRFSERVADDGYRNAVLLGMGGSSLAAEVLAATFGSAAGALELTVPDTTDPTTIQAVEQRVDLSKTLFIVASKSGTTIETLSHFAYFWEKVPSGRHFIAITDPGTPLERLGRDRRFRKVFLNPPDIGGRYSALSYFGLVPGALIGADIAALLDGAHELVQACHHCLVPAENAGAWLGAVLGEGALVGRDKLTLVLPEAVSAFGLWVEQLIAESTGKEGRGIVPVEGEPLGASEVYGDDRLFVAIGDHEELSALEQAGPPVVRLPYQDLLQLGAEFFRWECATAVAGHVLGINPFDQPNVQEAKDATARVLGQAAPEELEAVDIGSLLQQIGPGDYVAIQAYLPRTRDVDAQLQAVRLKLRDRYRVATTVGHGPRFLHSTGQLHKGGPNTGVFVQIVSGDDVDLPIPGKPYTFVRLKRAQALGDFQTLRAQGRRVARVTLDQLLEVAR